MRVAIVGFGNRGKKLFEAAQQCMDIKVVAICDPRTTSISLPGICVYQDIDKMLANEQIDMAIVAVPHDSYVPIITKLAEKKIHIIKEKPFATSPEEAKVIHKVLKENQVEMMIAVQRRFDTLYQVFKEMLPSVGQISYIKGSYTMNIDRLDEGWRASKQYSGGGALSDLGYHFVDLLIWYFGVPTLIYCSTTSNSRVNQEYDVEDSTYLNFEYMHNAMSMDKKTIGSFFLSRFSADVGEMIEVQGQYGRLKLTTSAIEFYDIHNKPIRKLNNGDHPKIQPLVNMIEHFVHYIRGDIKQLSADYKSHIDHLKIIQSAYEADRTYDQGSYASIKSRLFLDSPKMAKRGRDDSVPCKDMQSPELTKKSAIQTQPDFVWPIITDQTRQAIMEQLTSSTISCYDKSGIVEVFENNFARYHNRKYALATNSGTSAIHALYHAINSKPGDEVLVPSNTFHATISPLMQTGAIPKFVDCQQNGNIDPTDLRRKITVKTKAVMITHMWGIPCSMDEIVKICQDHNLILLEDCSHAHGARYKGRLVGTFGHGAIWSLNGPKIISGGEGGILLTDDKEIEVRANLLGQYHKRAKQITPSDHPLNAISLTGYGLKHRITTMSAAMANEQFSHLDEWLKYKRLYANMFRSAIEKIPLFELPDIQDCQPAWYAFTFYIKKNTLGITRDQFISACQEIGLTELSSPGATQPQFSQPLFQTPAQYLPHLYAENPPWPYPCPNSIDLYNRCIKMPMWARECDLAMVNKYISGIYDVARQLTKDDQKTFSPLLMKI